MIVKDFIETCLEKECEFTIFGKSHLLGFAFSAEEIIERFGTYPIKHWAIEGDGAIIEIYL